MSMLVKIVTFTGKTADSIEAEINNASAQLSKEGRFVIDVSFVEGLASTSGFPCAMLRHMPDDSADYMKKAIDAENALQRIVDSIKPAEKPEAETYDDTESAYGNGMDVANWEVAEDIERVIGGLRR